MTRHDDSTRLRHMLDHAVEACIDDRIERLALRRNDELPSRSTRDNRRALATLPLRQGDICRVDDLERAHDALRISGLQPRCHNGVAGHELLVEIFR